jgi:glutathione S-transferase
MSIFNDVQSMAASSLRAVRGVAVRPHNVEHPPRPQRLVELFSFEACPYCRKVREALSELDLAYIARTCPKGDRVNRPDLEQLGGKQQFPYLVDLNTGTELYESEQIIDYLFEEYGPGRSALRRFAAPLNTLTAGAASAVRPRGARVRDGLEDRDQPDERPFLYNFENSPYCRKVRERLCELNLDYEVRNVAKESTRRPELVERGGQMMVPYLVDPNTGMEMYESDDIVEYLDATYGPQS